MEDITRSQFRQVGQVMIEDCFDVPKIPGFWVLGVCTQRLASTKVWVVLLSILPQTLQDIRVELRIDSLTFGMNSKHKSPWKFKKQQAFSSCINLCDSKSSRLEDKAWDPALISRDDPRRESWVSLTQKVMFVLSAQVWGLWWNQSAHASGQERPFRELSKNNNHGVVV